MDIKHLHIQNFLTIGKASLELDERGLLLIQGENTDDPSAESNGAGKSSIVDALCWGLYGVTARGVSTDAVVNKTAKKDCRVFVTLVDGPNTYKVERYRKDSSFKNQLLVWQLDAKGDHSVDLSKGTDKETQEVVNQIIGCSLDVFMAAVYAGQEKMPDLPGMTDKQLKLLIEEAAGVELLAEAYNEARTRHNAAKSGYDAKKMSRDSLVAMQSDLNTELADIEAKHKTFEDGRKDRAKIHLAGVKTIEDAKAQELLTLSTFDQPAIKTEMADCDAKLAARKSQDDELRRLDGEAKNIELEITSIRTRLSSGKTLLESKQADLADLDALVGKPCGECGKEYCEHDLEGAKEARQKSIEETKNELRPLMVKLKDAQERHTRAIDAANTYRAGMTDVSAVAARKNALNAELNELATIVQFIARQDAEIESLRNKAKGELTAQNPWTRAVEVKKAEIEKCQERIKELDKELSTLEAQVELLADAVKVFGPAGVRAHILDTVTPFLNDRTSDYLGALADGNIHAVWNTLTKTAKGDLKEKFNIEVENDKGAESFAGLSGGEKRKVRIATAMALQDMVASRATKPINIFIADEVDHALDESGLERLMGVLDRKAKERGTVLVISHNALSDWIDNVITVTKSGGVATVSGATERGF